MGRAALFVWRRGCCSHTQTQANFKLAGVLLLCSYGSTTPSLGYANHLRSWINSCKKPTLHSVLSQLYGRYFKACSNTSAQQLQHLKMLQVSPVLQLLFVLLVVTPTVTGEARQKATQFVLWHLNTDLLPSAAQVWAGTARCEHTFCSAGHPQGSSFTKVPWGTRIQSQPSVCCRAPLPEPFSNRGGSK